jgi:metallopeptidase MepB
LGFGQAQFPHAFRKYDAGYFAYPMSVLYFSFPCDMPELDEINEGDRSMVYAADLYAGAFAEDPLNEVAGRRYRYMVLQPGSSQSEVETLEKFLGRKLSFNAFFNELEGNLEDLS